MRNVGANGFTDVALRDEINEGHIPGPHMQVSGPALGITGGHMDENLLPSQYHVVGEGVADGIPAVQHMVRENIKYGADLIKIGASGGVLSKGDDPQASQYTQEEMAAIVADAHRLGRKVAAHAHGAQAILWATNAGVDSIEHGSYLDDAGIAAMKAHGTYLVPTAYLIDWVQANGKLPVFYQQKMKDVSAVEKQNAIKAIKAGVKVALGTDAAVYPHGLNAHELDVYVNQFGMTPLQAIQTGTINAADLMGWPDKVGFADAGTLGGHHRSGRRSAERREDPSARELRHEGRGSLEGAGQVVHLCKAGQNGSSIFGTRSVSGSFAGWHCDLEFGSVMKASALEFRLRYLVHGVIYALGFTAPWNYLLNQNAGTAEFWSGKTLWLPAALEIERAGWMSLTGASNLLLVLGILFALASAGLRTWGAAYLGSAVVKDAGMHGNAVIADGPYRFLRNPLYLGTFLHTFAVALLMPPSGGSVRHRRDCDRAAKADWW